MNYIKIFPFLKFNHLIHLYMLKLNFTFHLMSFLLLKWQSGFVNIILIIIIIKKIDYFFGTFLPNRTKKLKVFIKYLHYYKQFSNLSHWFSNLPLRNINLTSSQRTKKKLIVSKHFLLCYILFFDRQKTNWLLPSKKVISPEIPHHLSLMLEKNKP